MILNLNARCSQEMHPVTMLYNMPHHELLKDPDADIRSNERRLVALGQQD